MALAASAAMPRTLLIAALRVAAMVFSASASLAASLSSSDLRSASDAVFSFSRVSAPIALDLVLACVDQRADARQREARHDDVERDEEDGQRDQLRGERRRIERRK